MSSFAGGGGSGGGGGGSSVQNVLWTPQIDFTAAPATYTFALPVGSKWFIDKVFVEVDTLNGSLTTQISYQFGITGTNAKYLATKAGLLLNVLNAEEEWTNFASNVVGEVNFNFTIVVAGVLNTATLYKGKAGVMGRMSP